MTGGGDAAVTFPCNIYVRFGRAVGPSLLGIRGFPNPRIVDCNGCPHNQIAAQAALPPPFPIDDSRAAGARLTTHGEKNSSPACFAHPFPFPPPVSYTHLRAHETGAYR
eukprot:22085-Pyramimonas_sp.AAC.1